MRHLSLRSASIPSRSGLLKFGADTCPPANKYRSEKEGQWGDPASRTAAAAVTRVDCANSGPLGDPRREQLSTSSANIVIKEASEYSIEFSPKLRGARSRLYRRRLLQVNTRWKALAEIYTMHSFAPFSWDPSG